MSNEQIERAATTIKAEAERLGVEIVEQRSRLSDSIYLAVRMPAGIKGLDAFGVAEIRVSDHGTTTGTGRTLLSVRTDLPHHDRLLDMALALIRFAAGERGSDSLSPGAIRLRTQRTIQGKGGKRVPNPLWIGEAA